MSNSSRVYLLALLLFANAPAKAAGRGGSTGLDKVLNCGARVFRARSALYTHASARLGMKLDSNARR